MLQWYIRALADLFVNVKTYQPSIFGVVARDEINTFVPSDCAKKWNTKGEEEARRGEVCGRWSIVAAK